jgi:hypothetical protein
MCSPIFPGLSYQFLTSHSCSCQLMQLKVKEILWPTVTWPICLGVNPRLGPKTRFLLLSDICGLLVWGVLSEEMTGLLCTIAAAPRQRSLSRVRVSWDSWPYFTVSDLRLPFSSPPTTRMVTVEVFDPASTQGGHKWTASPPYIALARIAQKTYLISLLVLSLPEQQLVHRAVP